MKCSVCGAQEAYIGGRAIREARVPPPREPLTGGQLPGSLALEEEDGLGEGIPVVVPGEVGAMVVPERMPVDGVVVAMTEPQSGEQTEDHQNRRGRGSKEARRRKRRNGHPLSQLFAGPRQKSGSLPFNPKVTGEGAETED